MQPPRLSRRSNRCDWREGGRATLDQDNTDSPAGSSTPATHQQNAPSVLPPTLPCHLALFLWIPLLPSLPSPSLHSPIHVQCHTPAARDSTPRPAHPDQQNAPSLLLPLTLACHLAPTASPPHHTGSSTIPNDTSSFQLLPAFLFLWLVWFGLSTGLRSPNYLSVAAIPLCLSPACICPSMTCGT